ncbi:MAG: DUF5658 family protein [Desulfobacterales bacterium]
MTNLTPSPHPDPPVAETVDNAADRVERRSGRDRRRSGRGGLLQALRGGRRRALRRAEDRRRLTLLDHYPSRTFAAALGVVALSLLDAALTLYLVEHGAWEMNPVMAHFLGRSPLAFVVAKYCFTVVAVAIFVLVSPVVLPGSGIRARHFLRGALVLFAAVIVWEIVLLLRLFSRGIPTG